MTAKAQAKAAQAEADKWWHCPKCNAPANDHGKGGREKCKERTTFCDGLICQCDEEDSDAHGTPAEPCPDAYCHHCEWGGQVPGRQAVAAYKAEQRIDPKKLRGWAATAWEAGWRPPAKWKPA